VLREMPEFRIATYNLRSNDPNQRLHWKWIFEVANPDLLLLQEVFHPESYMPPAFWETYRSQVLWTNRPGQSWGCGLFLRSGTIKPIAIPTLEGWLVGAEIEGLPTLLTGGRSMRIFNIHAPQPHSESVHQALDWISHLEPQTELLIGGNFNLTTAVPRDAENLTESDRTLLERIRRRFNLMNAWQAANPNQPLPPTLQNSDDLSKQNHCDALFLPARWYRFLDQCEVLSTEEWDKLSDHRPIVATLNIT
jgi:exonuclease III